MAPELLFKILLVLPWLVAALLPLVNKYPNVREAVTIAGAIGLLLCVVNLYPYSLTSPSITLEGFALFAGVALKFQLEPLGMLFLCVVSLLWIANSAYSIGYLRKNAETNQTRFYVFFAIAIGTTVGIASAGNLATLFLFYELLTLSTYPLVTHKQTAAARKSGRIYLGYLLGSSITLFLLAVIWTWQLAGTLDFHLGGILTQTTDTTALSVLLCLYLFGIGKAAVMPLHPWLPAAMVAPTPVSALLHAVAVVKAGVFTFLKVVLYIFGYEKIAQLPITEYLVYVTGFSIIAASVLALQQDQLKLRLAYSTVSQLSYILMAALIHAPLAILAACLHLVVHAFGKITLFFTAGAIYTVTHKTKISELQGVAYHLPWTMAAFTVGALVMVGLPLTGGFVSKWYLLNGAFQAQAWFVIGVITLSTLLNAAYFAPIVYLACTRAKTPPVYTAQEAPLPMLIALLATAGFALALFFYATPFLILGQALLLPGPR